MIVKGQITWSGCSHPYKVDWIKCPKCEIERLQARVDELTTWISVKDRMPEPGERVIIFGKRSYQPKGFMRVTLIDGYGAWSGERYPEGHNEVTHWMNVPEPLEGEGK